MFSKNQLIVPVKYQKLYTICFFVSIGGAFIREQARSHKSLHNLVGASLLAKAPDLSAQVQPLPILGSLQQKS
ncbi:hypothetical protein BOO88_03545 [Stutzerimonas stutzeri]|nr:hypothetical protein BOO89_15340 [Stutzerimonas stutzeri]AZO88049.1 hypothetical protein BOO88_03545 [Stutzerimonas stutzeri]